MKRIALAVSIFALLLACRRPPAAVAAAAPARQVVLTADQRAALAGFNVRAAALEQEARAVAAERAVLQGQANAFLDQACKTAGGTRCQINSQDPDPQKWTLSVSQ